MMWMQIVTLGVLVGVVLGVTGAGGAMLSVPLLTVFLSLSVSQASPIALFAVAVSSAVAALLGLFEGTVRYKAAALMAATGWCFAPLGLWLAQRVPNAPLVLLFAAVLLWVAWRMWRSEASAQSNEAEMFNNAAQTFNCERSDVSGRFVWTWPCARTLAFTGGVAGFLSGLIGVGGGFIVVPSLKKNTNLNMPSIVATSLAIIALVSTSGVVVAAHNGWMDWRIATPFALGTLAGMGGGKWLAGRLPVVLQTRGFALLLVAAAGVMVGRLFD